MACDTFNACKACAGNSSFILQELLVPRIYGLRVGASVDRNESYTKTIDGKFAASRLSSNQKGQRCLERQPQCVNPSVDGPSDVHSLEAIKIADSQSASEILRSHGLKTKQLLKLPEGSVTPETNARTTIHHSKSCSER